MSNNHTERTASICVREAVRLTKKSIEISAAQIKLRPEPLLQESWQAQNALLRITLSELVEALALL